MDEAMEATDECVHGTAHNYIHEHRPGHIIYWVKVCSLCHRVDWDDLDREIVRTVQVA